MIPYEELCAALERYATRFAGAQAGARVAPSSPPPAREAPPVERAAPAAAAAHPTLAAPAEEETTHVSSTPGVIVVEDPSHEIDVGDILGDEEP
jgi:hypothetical protein